MNEPNLGSCLASNTHYAVSLRIKGLRKMYVSRKKAALGFKNIKCRNTHFEENMFSEMNPKQSKIIFNEPIHAINIQE
jgi:hypothetical protein